MKKVAAVTVASGVALAAVAVALASTRSTTSTSTTVDTYSFKATLTAGQEVPKSKGAPANAGGTFTGKSKESGSTITFHWVLTFHGLSGKAVAAHVHLGKPGKAGPVAVPLCGPCKTGQSGTLKIKSSLEDALEKGGAYVNVHTPKNPAGEIRGQVKLVGK